MDGGWQLWAKRGGEIGPANLAGQLVVGVEMKCVCVCVWGWEDKTGRMSWYSAAGTNANLINVL